MAVEARWYIIHTYSGYENKVAENIETFVENRKMQDKILGVCVPKEKVNEVQEVSVKILENKLDKMVITNEEFEDYLKSFSNATYFVVVLGRAAEDLINGSITQSAYERIKGKLVAECPEAAKKFGISLGSDKTIDKKSLTEARRFKKQLSFPVERKVFPGYVVVKLAVEYSDKEGEENVLKVPDETWHAIRYTRGVTGFVGPDGKPVPLTAEEVKNLGIVDSGASVVREATEVAYEVGDLVEITDGLMEGNSGVVETINTKEGIVRVIVSFMGKEAPIELALNQVKKVIE